MIQRKYPIHHPLVFLCLFLLIPFSSHSPAYATSWADLQAIQTIYIGYYQRPADPGGLIYWSGKLASSGGNLNEIIEAFANSPESQTLYGTINSGNIATVVNNIYIALFARDADAGGRDWYVAEFNAGRFTAATIMLNILNGATQGPDLLAKNNKLNAANVFTMTIDPELDGLNFQATYSGDGDAIAGRNFLSFVTADPATAQTQAGTTTYIQNNIAKPGDPIGSLTWLWAKSAGSIGAMANRGIGDYQDELCSVAVDASGNIFVVGTFTGATITFGSFTLTNTSSLGWGDVFLVKYAPNGNVLWAKSAGSLGLMADGNVSSHTDRGMSVTVDTSGNVYAAGTFSGYTITFGSFTLTKPNTVYNAVFLVKYDTSGNFLWARSAGGNSSHDSVYSLAPDAGGNIYVAGDFSSSTITFGSFTLTKPTTVYNALFLVKYDTSGNVLWARSAGGEPAYCVITDASGNIFVNTQESLFKYDANGNIIRTRSFAIKGQYSLAADASGNIYVAGGANMFLEKYDNAGNVLWTSGTGGSSGDTSANAVAVDTNGNIYMAGDFYQSTITVGSFTLTNTSNIFYHDVFLAKLSSQN